MGFLWLFLISPSLFASNLHADRPAKVLLFYVDGLRPDTVEEMVKEEQLPNIKNYFYEHGARFKNFFTIYPSNTLIANGLFMTGRWPEKSGLKTQAMFIRFPAGGTPGKKGYPKQFNLLTQTEVAPRVLKESKTKAIYNYLGERYHAGVAPINPYPAPTAWPHVAANAVDRPYLVTTEAPDKIDGINGEYALRYMTSDPRGQVFMVWFAGLDEDQHRTPSGQFGEVREKMVEVDKWIGRIVERMKRQDTNSRFYIMLFSDHGAYGGKEGIPNQPFHIARDYLYEQLKMNVLGPDFSITHPGTDSKSYVYVDNMGRGQAKLFLPVADSTSADWSRPNTFYELTHYGLGPNRKPINLVKALSEIDLRKRNEFRSKTTNFPVDFVIIKISHELFYVRRGESEGLIAIKKEQGKDLYRYWGVRNFEQDIEGKLSYDEDVSVDPFDYMKENLAANFFKEYHDESEWLKATYKSEFPDAVVALCKSSSWSPELITHARSEDADIILSAAPGWNFRIENIKGADHGSIRRDSMLATFMVSGPDIRVGEIETPHRLIELLPTIFEIIDYKKKTTFDALPLDEIYAK
jgi:hypothetical protein